ncbi:NAD-dependent protein deacetylase [Streptomyces rimosus subsp. rimosus]
MLELHGTARTVLCTGCGARSPMSEALERVAAGDPDPACTGCGGILKSATVMFGERLDPEVLGTAVSVAQAADVFIAVGTSLQVQPAASLAGLAAEHGARLIIVNAEPTPYDELAAETIRTPIGTALPELLATLAPYRTAPFAGNETGNATVDPAAGRRAVRREQQQGGRAGQAPR